MVYVFLKHFLVISKMALIFIEVTDVPVESAVYVKFVEYIHLNKSDVKVRKIKVPLGLMACKKEKASKLQLPLEDTSKAEPSELQPPFEDTLEAGPSDPLLFQEPYHIREVSTNNLFLVTGDRLSIIVENIGDHLLEWTTLDPEQMQKLDKLVLQLRVTLDVVQRLFSLPPKDLINFIQDTMKRLGEVIEARDCCYTYEC